MSDLVQPFECMTVDELVRFLANAGILFDEGKEYKEALMPLVGKKIVLKEENPFIRCARCEDRLDQGRIYCMSCTDYMERHTL